MGLKEAGIQFAARLLNKFFVKNTQNREYFLICRYKDKKTGKDVDAWTANLPDELVRALIKFGKSGGKDDLMRLIGLEAINPARGDRLVLLATDMRNQNNDDIDFGEDITEFIRSKLTGEE